MKPKGFPGFQGDIVLPRDPAYPEARQEWNRRIDKFPRAIAYCESRDDVSRCIRWARQRGVPLRIRSGGHHYEGYSTGNGVLVIDLSRMNTVRAEGGFVYVQGGAANYAIYDAVAATGNIFPGGTCPTVCVSGYTQGGGWGYLGRLLGLGCDSLESVELIDSCGRVVNANSHNNEALFWALRGGGGGNFGVVTALKFRLPDIKPEVVTLVELYWPDADAAKQAQVWEAVQQWQETADERITLQTSIYVSAEEGYAAYGRGIFCGPPQEAQEAIAALSELPGTITTLTPGTFGETMKRIGDTFPPYEKFKSTGRFVIKPLSPEHIARLVSTLQEPPEGSVFAAYTLYAMGGAIARRRPGETAFFYRNARYITGFQSIWEKDAAAEANIEWVNQNYPVLASVTSGSFVNFPYSNLKDYMRAYYGGNAARLRRVKRLYDPCNVFRFPQSIRFEDR